MADAATVTELINYYINLLIIQYNNQPKAQATIRLLATELLANGIALDVRDGFNLDDAVGKQLDVLGKYQDVDRFSRDQTLVNFFGLTFYSEIDPDATQKFGFTDYADFGLVIGNGTLTYDSIVTLNNRLIDDFFRQLIRLAILVNNMNYSHEAIDNALFQIFGSQVWAESFGHMHMFFFVTGIPTDLIKAIIFKGLLPKPLAVGAIVVENFVAPAFGMTDFRGYTTPYEYGFSTYSNFDTLPGTEITYDQILTE